MACHRDVQRTVVRVLREEGTDVFCLAWEALVCNRAPEVSHVFGGLSCGAQGTFPGAGRQREQRQHEEGCWERGSAEQSAAGTAGGAAS